MSVGLVGARGAALPAGGQVHAVHQGQQRRLQLQLRQQREVVRGDVRVRAPRDVVVHQPLRVQRAQHSEHVHVGVGVENVVDHTLRREGESAVRAGPGGRRQRAGVGVERALRPSSWTWGRPRSGSCHSRARCVPELGAYFEVKGVIGVRHQVVLVGALQLEAVRDPALRGSVLAVAAEVHETLVVAQLLEVLVVVSYYAIAQVFHYTCGQGEGFRESL